MFMLVYPFTFYAINGLFTLLRGYSGWKNWAGGFSRKAALGALGVTVLMGSVYLVTPLLMNSAQGGVFALSYVSAHFSSAPAVPYQDVEGVSQAMMWLNENIGDNSCVLVNYVFALWDNFYLDKSHVKVQFWNAADLGVDLALDRGFGSVYFVWWNQDIGWYDVTVPSQFTALRDFGRISVYEFTGTVQS